MKLNKSILIIGPLPEPINGCSLANIVLKQNLIRHQYRCGSINTSTPKISSKQGDYFSISKALRFFLVYLKIYKVFQYDVLYITPGQTFYGVLKYSPFIYIAKLLKKPFVIHVHGNYLGKEYESLSGAKRSIFHSLLSKASAGIVLSKTLLNNFEKLLDTDKVFIVKNFFPKKLSAGELIIKDISKLKILYLSNLMPEKGIYELLGALSILSRNNIPYEATIAGEIELKIEKNLNDKLKLLSSSVTYVGPVHGDRKRDLLENSNVFVLPTYYQMEGQPISIIEALSTGNIIVSTNHAGIPDIIDSRNGFLISPKSTEELANCLTEISANIEKYVLKYSKKNVQYAFSNFTESKFSENLISILSKL